MSVLALLLFVVPFIAASNVNSTDGKRLARQDLRSFLNDDYDLLSYSSPLTYARYGSLLANDQAQTRNFGLGLINTLLFNNRFNNANRPFGGLINASPLTLNPNFPNLLTTFDSCTAPNGESGICAPSGICSVFGGRPSGNCLLGKVCCINVVSRCGATATLNNTYWQSPPTPITTTTTCSMNIRLDASLKEQKQPICQVRLDFISFTNAQPNAQTVCDTDSFQVGGAINNVPVICGENANQHMYIQVPNSGFTSSDVRLLFTFTGAAAGVNRAWNIKISLLPCGASYLAPDGCLQYFTSGTGSIRSFNWRDAAVAAGVRQLANQNYDICFRTELIDNQRATTLCASECTVVNAGAAFSLTNAGTSQGLPTTAAPATFFCLNDFLTIVGGFDPALTAVANNAQDRFCGGRFNVAYAAATSATVCTRVSPFRMHYQTNGDEAAVLVGANTAIPADAVNMGFCLSFTMRTG